MAHQMTVLGLNSAYHEPSVALVRNGIVVAAEEERFNRVRHGKPCLIDNPHVLPFKALDFCLAKACLNFGDVDHIAFSFDPEVRLKKNVGIEKDVIEGDWGSESGERKFYDLNCSIPQILETRYHVSLRDRWHWIPHHVAHASSAFFPSPFDEAAVLTVDGIGEYNSAQICRGIGNRLEIVEELGEYPSSIGFLWTKACRFLNMLLNGMAEYSAGTLMALAPYGNSERYYKTFRSFVQSHADGSFAVDGDIQQFRSDSQAHYEALFGFPQRHPNEAFKQEHMDFAAALQRLTNELVLGLAIRAHKLTNSKCLCMAGGVTLNCVTNSYILKNGPFQNIFVQPAANDMGTALGAALYVKHHVLGAPKTNTLFTPFLGAEFSSDEISETLTATPDICFEKVQHIEDVVAFLLSKGCIVAWFQGQSEFGPRALGNRSILADPRRTDIHERLSVQIKGREWFRPLAPAVLEENVDDWFTRPKGGAESDKWMLFAYEVRADRMGQIPAVTHFDGSARIQRVANDPAFRLRKVIQAFHALTGVPIVANTSFNIKEPMVNTPTEAIATFLRSQIEFLAINDYLVVKKGGQFDLDLMSRLPISLRTHFEHMR